MEQIRKVLVVSYSQSGQLNDITDNFTAPLHNVELDAVRYSPEVPFPFPWTSEAFFEAMPGSVMEMPVEINKIEYKYPRYDLIIFAYQPWFLSPSIPASSLLQDSDFLSRVHGTPVITLIGSRNMWLNSQESVKSRITEAGSRIIANLPFIDRTQNQVSAITILHWMLTGRKTRKYNLFPKPGVSDADILYASEFGRILNDAIEGNDLSNLQSKFLATGRITLSINIMFIEERARRLFKIWTRGIVRYGTSPSKRRWLLKGFRFYLVIALFVVAPVVAGIYNVLVVPFILKALDKRKQLYLQQTSIKCPYL